MSKYTDDDYCDIYEKKICDNCGKCLEEEGIDIRAIKIEDIAKDVAENKALEEEYMAKLKELKEEEENEELERELPPLDIDEEELKAAYKKLQEETGIDFSNYDEDEEYEDAFDHIVSLEDADLAEDGAIDDLTEEVFPGVRKLKKFK
ncbi:MAG: hypothetical protein ACI33J_11960 [Clostridium sp.]